MEFIVEKIIIADDHPMFRSALTQSVLSDYPDCEIIECESLSSLKSNVKSHLDADLLILDLNMPGAEGFSSLIYMRDHYPEIPIIMISAIEKPEIIYQSKSYGALGYISKSANIESIRNAIRTVLNGELYFPDDLDQYTIPDNDDIQDITRAVVELTPQQYKILQMIKKGLLNKQIAYDLKITEATVKAHVTAIMKKLKANNRTQAVMKVASIEFNNDQ